MTLFRGEDLTDLLNSYEQINIEKCIICNSDQFEVWAKTDNYITNKCCNCGLIFMNPQLSPEGLNEYYDNYIGKRRVNNLEKMKLRSEQYTIDSSLIKKFITSGKLLDIGCNGGFFLNSLGDKFERYGTEIDSSSVEYAINEFPEFSKNIINDDFKNVKFENNFFDLITMRGVIEHVPDPENCVKEVARILKNNGLFYICATPNGESYCADLYRENWNLFHPIQHLWHYSEKNLSILCKKYDLELTWSEYHYLNTPYENIDKDLKKINDAIKMKVSGEDINEISPPFFENMLSLIFRKI